MTGIQTNQHFTQQNNQIFMYFQHTILLHAAAHIIDEFIPKPFLTIQQTSLGFRRHLITNFPHIYHGITYNKLYS